MAYSEWLSVVSGDSPVAWWEINDTGSEYPYSGGGGKIQSKPNGATQVQGPMYGSAALQFNGSNQYIATNDDNVFDLADTFTYEWWVKLDTLHWSFQFNKGTNAPTARIYDIGGGNYRIQCGKYGVAGIVETTQNISAGVWYHCVWTRDGAAAEDTNFYLNGVDVTGSTTASIFMANTSTEFRMGTSAEGTEFLDGTFAQLVIYNYALTSTQVQEHYASASAVSVSADLTDIEVLAHETTVTIDNANNVSISTDTSNITLDAIDPTYVGPTDVTIEAEETDIETNAWDASFAVAYQDYDNIITAAGPYRWYQFVNNLNDTTNGVHFTGSGGTVSYSDIDAITGTTDDVYFSNITAGASRQTASQNAQDIGHSLTHGSTTEFFIRTSKLTGVFLNWKDTSTGSYTTHSQYSAWNGEQYEAAIQLRWVFGTGFFQVWGVNNGYLATANGFGSSGDVITAGTGFSPSSEASAISSARSSALNQSIDSAFGASWVTSSKYIADGQWHHVAIVTRLDSGSYTHKTYVDGTEIGTNLNTIYGLSSYTGTLGLGRVTRSFSGSSGTTSKVVDDTAASISLDELVFYQRGLSEAEVLDHYDSRYGTFLSDPSVEVIGETANITVDDSDSTVSLPIQVSVDTTDINIDEKSVTISGLGDTLHGADAGLITMLGLEANVTAERNRNVILTEPADIDVGSPIVAVFTSVDDLNLFFVPPDSLPTTAFDSPELTEVSMGAFLFAQEKKRRVRVGNPTRFNTAYKVTTFTSNEDLIPHITYSLDDVTYTDTVTTATVVPYGISELVYVKVNFPPTVEAGDGNFLINVEAINVDAS